MNKLAYCIFCVSVVCLAQVSYAGSDEVKLTEADEVLLNLSNKPACSQVYICESADNLKTIIDQKITSSEPIRTASGVDITGEYKLKLFSQIIDNAKKVSQGSLLASNYREVIERMISSTRSQLKLFSRIQQERFFQILVYWVTSDQSDFKKAGVCRSASVGSDLEGFLSCSDLHHASDYLAYSYRKYEQRYFRNSIIEFNLEAMIDFVALTENKQCS